MPNNVQREALRIESDRESTRLGSVPPPLPHQTYPDAIDDRQLFGRNGGGIRIEAAHCEIPLA
jgi:hypothetical protein